jgi:hypothetical protein
MTATKTKKSDGKNRAAKGAKAGGKKKGDKPAKAKTKADAIAKGEATEAAPADDANLVPIKRTKAKAAKTKKLSAIDAAAQVLAASKEPMSCRELIAAMAEQGLWTSPGGATPWATLYSAMLREVRSKGKDARFKKTDRGRFAANG